MISSRVYFAFMSISILANATNAVAGIACEQRVTTPKQMRTAAATSARVVEQLEQKNTSAALLMRHGTDLSKYGLHYSHAGFVVRDHQDGRWRVVHLLNECGSNKSNIYVEGLINFFADDLLSDDVKIVWLKGSVSKKLVLQLSDENATRLHSTRYNIIARADNGRSQNSTAWVLDMLVAAQFDSLANLTLNNIKQLALAHGHQADIIHIPYSNRIIGGLFSVNADFTDHSLKARLSGKYPVVTVRSILRYLKTQNLITMEWERRNQQELSSAQIQLETAQTSDSLMGDDLAKL